MKEFYDPLTAYADLFRDRFREVAERTFAELAEEARVDLEANRATCRRLYAEEKRLASVKARANRWTVWGIVLWLIAIGGTVAVIVLFRELEPQLLLAILLAVAMALLNFGLRAQPRIKALTAERTALTESVNRLKDEAWEQMSPLNRLYDWDILTRMMSQTVPNLEFDPYFTTQRLADLKATYGWDDAFNADRSVIHAHSGLINGNPFIICRTRRMVMGTKTYYGSKTISWTTSERGADGKYRTVRRTQVLTASVTAPYPEYFEKTRVIYGNTAAPDLVFTRKQSGLAGNENSLPFKWKRRSLRKKARNLSNADFAMMTNEEFEVAFDTSDRNDNRQFALLFTPLAQESMMKLLKDCEAGFGDDFDFAKHRMINTIVPAHMQELDLDMNPGQYRHFDYDRAKAEFQTLNARYFRAIYFSLAPLLCIPMYQQIRPRHEIYGRDMQRRSAFWEHEALANFWGQQHFKHPRCVTDCILKTEQEGGSDGRGTITVRAHGYGVQRHLTYITKWGGDGRSHRVPVYWDEYHPVTGCGRIHMAEDNDCREELTQRQRMDHIDHVLEKSRCDLYRRHIASKI